MIRIWYESLTFAVKHKKKILYPYIYQGFIGSSFAIFLMWI